MLLKNASSFQDLASRCVREGRQETPISGSLDFSGKCQKPVFCGFSGILMGDAEAERTQRGYSSSDPRRYVDVEAKCRKCPACLRERAALWRMRAMAEIKAAPRTWMGTLTLSHEAHYLMQCRATVREPSFDRLTIEEQFPLRHREVSTEITKMLKRLRKAHGVPGGIRTLVVAERHKNGLPHYHLLLHEVAEIAPVRKALLRDLWSWGFSTWRLTDGSERAAFYVAKYLAKDASARIRASRGYGNPLTALAIFDQHQRKREGVSGKAEAVSPFSFEWKESEKSLPPIDMRTKVPV